MVHANTKIYIHAFWATEQEGLKLQDEIQYRVQEFIIQQLAKLSVPLQGITIEKDHIHVLIELSASMPLSIVIQKIKGSSSNWINKQKFFVAKFRWNRGYDAYSISASQLDGVLKYMENQESYHQEKTYAQECKNWRRKYNIER